MMSQIHLTLKQQSNNKSLMKMNLFQLFILLIFAISFDSCKYEPAEIYQRLVNKNAAPPEFQVIDLNFITDTIFLYSDRGLHFNFKSTNQTINSVQFTIDNKILSTFNSDTGVFYVNYTSLTEGIHSLVIDINVSLQTKVHHLRSFFKVLL
jgi:hypothetical protein